MAAKLIVQSAWCGWYFSVREPGTIAAGEEFENHRRPRARSASSSCSAPVRTRRSFGHAPAMLAYRHAFHAGNHADVLKHTVLTLVLRYMNAKDKPLPPGRHPRRRRRLFARGRYAQKKGEFEQGIGRLWDARRPAGAAGRLRRAGAPVQSGRQADASTPARRRSRRCCCARRTSCACSSCIRPTTASSRAYLGRRRGARGLRRRRLRRPEGRSCRRRPGAACADRPELRGQRRLRPRSSPRCARRSRASPKASTSSGIRRSASSRRRSCRAASTALAPKGWLHARLTVQQPDAQGFGLAGSGVFVINPPYTLHAPLATCCRIWSTCSASTPAPTS